MFLSSSSSSSSRTSDEGSPDNPSTSSKFLHLANTSDELGQSHHSSFSIRDYACNYRTKNIQKSWPFSSTRLQLRLKHGLSDPLPPMHPLNSAVSHPPETSSSKKPHIAQVEAISFKRNFEKLGSSDALAETKQGFENGSKSKVRVDNVNKNPRQICGLIVKPGACVDSETKEDQGCLFESIMASRTCPICKSFSSASNTTLNAHIDKCLSVDSGQQPISKPRRKVKTMVDIYATAKRCTLEDLDERNGTKWAVVSSYSNEVVSDKNRTQLCNKRKNHSVVDEDAKGQKLRTISEFNENASDPSREHVEDVSEKKTSKEESKGNYRSFRKRLGGKKYYKLCKGDASEILEYRTGYSEECRGMERSGPTQPSENGHSLSSADPLVPRGRSHVSAADLSETVSSPLKIQNSWRSCGESQVSGKIIKVFASDGKDVMKLKKDRLDFSEEEDSGRWESEMTQEHVPIDYDDWDDNKETDASTSGGEETINNNNKGDGNILDKNNDADAEFESMVYEQTGCETAEPGESTFMDPIPIPGPPGSFLQSPWDMETDDVAEHHGNFSVITSHVQSSQDQLDFTDRNPSESPLSKFAAPETDTFSLHNIITTDKSQSCYCQRKEKAFEDRTLGQSAPHMIQQDVGLLSKFVPAAPSSSNSVLRLMGKNLMVINQREETSHENSSLKPTPQFQDLSKTQHASPPVHLIHLPYGGNHKLSQHSVNSFDQELYIPLEL